jgi:hypothetical protein
MFPDVLDFITSSPLVTATVVVVLAISLGIAVHAMFDA